MFGALKLRVYPGRSDRKLGWGRTARLRLQTTLAISQIAVMLLLPRRSGKN